MFFFMYLKYTLESGSMLYMEILICQDTTILHTYTWNSLKYTSLREKIMIHIENKELICKDTEMTSSLGKTYTIIETRSLDYF